MCTDKHEEPVVEAICENAAPEATHENAIPEVTHEYAAPEVTQEYAAPEATHEDSAPGITEPEFYDAKFYQKRKHGKYREVDAPLRYACVADTHEHIQLTANPALVLAKAAVWNVSFFGNVIDLVEDGLETIQRLDEWQAQAADIAAEIAPSVMVEPEQARAAAQTMDIRIIAGVHPHNAKHYTPEVESMLRHTCENPRVCGIGEAGLDFFYNISPQETQIAMFKAHIRLAKELDLPLCLHLRDAHDIAYEIVRKEGLPQRGAVLHCFNLDSEVLKPWIDLGVYVGFDGPLTFKKNDYVREAAKLVPLNRLLTETDAPFMTPEPMRGMLCGPAHVVYTLDLLAEVRGCETWEEKQAFAQQLMNNAQAFYGRQR